jgi:hypothetical protein
MVSTFNKKVRLKEKNIIYLAIPDKISYPNTVNPALRSNAILQPSIFAAGKQYLIGK